MGNVQLGVISKTLRNFVGGRVREVVLMLGFPFAGPVFALDSFSPDLGWRLLAFAGAMFLLFLSLYEFNAYCGHQADAFNPRLQPLGQDPRTLYLKRAAATLGGAVFIFFLLRPVLALAAVTSFMLWSLYSWPRWGWKEVPVLGTGIHFFTQALHFLMGWSLVADVTSSGILIAFFFAGLFSGGHLYHEVIDFEADRLAGIRTMANRIGRQPALLVSTGVFFVVALYWAVLFVLGHIEPAAFFPFLGAFFIHAILLVVFSVSGRLAHQAGAIQLRGLYRMCYLFAGLGFLVQRFS